MKRIVLLVAVWTAAVTSAAAAGDPQNGKKLFNERACNSCHAIGTQGSATTGPNLAGVAQRRSHAWLKKWLMNPDQMKNDPVARKIETKYHSQMPNLGLTDAQAEDLIAFIATIK